MFGPGGEAEIAANAARFEKVVEALKEAGAEKVGAVGTFLIYLSCQSILLF